MKKKIVAVILSAALLLSFPLTVVAASFRVPEIGEVVTAVQADLHERMDGMTTLAKLNVSLLRTLTERAQNIEITADDVKAAADEVSDLIASVYAKMGSYAQRLLNKVQTKIESLKPTEPDEPSTPSQPGNPTGPSNPSQPGNPTEPEKPTEPDKPEEPAETITFADLSKELRKYIFIKVDNADEVAELIAQSCDFKYTTVQDGNGTVYIRVNIEENPEIFNYAVFRNLVEDLYAQQGEEMLKNDDGEVDYLMSYEHIAGELALHALLYAASNEVLRVTGISSSRLLNLYKSAAQADLNVDEARIPSELISIVGVILMNFMSYHLLNAFGLI